MRKVEAEFLRDLCALCARHGVEMVACDGELDVWSAAGVSLLVEEVNGARAKGKQKDGWETKVLYEAPCAPSST